ncbi:hypothetical protein BC749_1272 [Flavobacterium araucananum]|nr:hypothetical protein BC749_1272 [Flavobacterium araucananum]
MRKIQFSNNNMVIFVSIDYKLTHCFINTSFPGSYDLYAVLKIMSSLQVILILCRIIPIYSYSMK